MLIDEELIRLALDKALSTGADFAEIFIEDKISDSVSMVKGRVDTVSTSLVSGVGIRAYSGLKSFYATTSVISRDAVLDAASDVASCIGEGRRTVSSFVLTERKNQNIHPVRINPSCVSVQDKLEFLHSASDAALSYSGRISQVTARLSDVNRRITVANSYGLITSDRQVRTILALSSVASSGGESQSGSASFGRSMGLEMLTDLVSPRDLGTEASRQAVVNLESDYFPAGVYPVVIESGFGGVIFHEACGHSLEATSVAFDKSEFAGRKGQRIANDCVTAVDDGTIPNAWGSVNIDDEGTPARKTVLIDRGILTSYLVDRFNGRRMNEESTGSARRQSYTYAPTSRMTNTYIAAGNDDDDQIIASIDHGLYCAKMGGGSVNPLTGEFNFSVSEAYEIKDGRIGRSVRGASLIGRGSQIIQDIDMVGKNVRRGQGMCGSASGSIPVDVGQPRIRVRSMVVGGR